MCRKGKFPTYHKLTRHTTKSTKYSNIKAPPIAVRFCCQVLKNQQKFAKCHAKTNHTSARVSDDISGPIRL